LMRLEPESEHPHGMADAEFDALFTTDRPIIFAYHGYPWLIHRLAYRRTGHRNLHVRGYKEEGTTTTPFDMVMLNDLDRFHLVMDVIDRVPGLGPKAAHLRQDMVDRRLEYRAYTRLEGEDHPDVRDWTWPRCTSRSRWPPWRRCRPCSQASRPWRASTLPSTPPCRRPRRPTRCRRSGALDGPCAGTGSTGCPTPTPRGEPPRWSAVRPR